MILDERQINLHDDGIEKFFGLIDKYGHGRVTFEDFKSLLYGSDSKVGL